MLPSTWPPHYFTMATRLQCHFSDTSELFYLECSVPMKLYNLLYSSYYYIYYIILDHHYLLLYMWELSGFKISVLFISTLFSSRVLSTFWMLRILFIYYLSLLARMQLQEDRNTCVCVCLITAEAWVQNICPFTHPLTWPPMMGFLVSFPRRSLVSFAFCIEWLTSIPLTFSWVVPVELTVSTSTPTCDLFKQIL